jgi:aspartate aminotransferase
MVHAAGATAVLVPTRLENGYALDPGALRDYLTPSSKLLILNSPSNPTGAVCPRQVLTEVAELAVRHGFMVLADEIYEKLVYDAGFEHVSIASLNPEIRERTVTVNGFSKAYSMTGWRLGYLTGPLWLVKRISALQDHTTSNPTSFAQAGALAALTGPQEPVEDMRRAFAARRDRIYELLSQIPNLKVPKPHGAFYIFPDISAYGLGSMAFVEKMLEKVRLAAIPGKPFGADNCVRLSYACSLDSIEKACARLAEFCRSL